MPNSGPQGTESALLVQFEGETIRQQWPLVRSTTRIGRWPDNDVVIEDRWVSRYDAEVRREGHEYAVRDLDSKNGTYVNGRRLSALSEAHRLTDGDQISVAPLYTLTFVDYAATAPLPAPQLVPQTTHRPAALEVDAETRDVHVWGRRLDPLLSQIQYDFLELLLEDPGRADNRDEVIAAVWPGEDPAGISDDAVNALVHRLRQRLRELEPAHDFILTVRGYGFRLALP